MTFDRQDLAQRAASLAAQGVYVGTSSWKYPGWCGTPYDRSRYEYRGRFAETRFKRDCLAEYGGVFKTVCVDAAYYTFPSAQYLEGMVNLTPDDFLFYLNVTDAITIKKFPGLDRFGQQAGKADENFLNADLFTRAFLKPCEAVRPAIGLLMFEFSRFWPTDYEHGPDFIADLDKFLGALPKGWPYGAIVESIFGSNVRWRVGQRRSMGKKGGKCLLFCNNRTGRCINRRRPLGMKTLRTRTCRFSGRISDWSSQNHSSAELSSSLARASKPYKRPRHEKDTGGVG